MKWIGLTGGMGSGKTAVASYLRSKNYIVIDADQIARDVVAVGTPGARQVIQAFGKVVQNPDGSLDRKKIAELVFSHPGKLKELEQIVHPLVQQRVRSLREQYVKQNVGVAFYDVPLLFEKKMQGQFDQIIVVSASDVNRISRLRQRDGHDLAHIQKRMAAQLPLVSKEKLAHYIIRNDAGWEELHRQIDEVLRHLPAPGAAEGDE